MWLMYCPIGAACVYIKGPLCACACVSVCVCMHLCVRCWITGNMRHQGFYKWRTRRATFTSCWCWCLMADTVDAATGPRRGLSGWGVQPRDVCVWQPHKGVNWVFTWRNFYSNCLLWPAASCPPRPTPTQSGASCVPHDVPHSKANLINDFIVIFLFFCRCCCHKPLLPLIRNLAFYVWLRGWLVASPLNGPNRLQRLSKINTFCLHSVYSAPSQYTHTPAPTRTPLA